MEPYYADDWVTIYHGRRTGSVLRYLAIAGTVGLPLDTL